MADNSARPLMKDSLGTAAVERLAMALGTAGSGFDASLFRRRALTGLAELELKDRVRHLVAAMAAALPEDFSEALPVVLAAGENFPPRDQGDERHDFASWPLVDWVPVYGLDDFTASLAALRRLTPLFSAEFAIRPFLLADPEQALAVLHTWLDDEDPHVRRLVSEGTRPRLPWGEQLPMFRADPSPVLELLVKLRDDPSEYVRRSVANNLNDIVKDHPGLVVETAVAWWSGASPQRKALVKHGLRTLIKQGDAGALTVLGYTTDPQVKLQFGLSAAQLPIGDAQELSLHLQSTAKNSQKLVVDYVVHHQRANGKMTAKVFKWRVVDLPAGGELHLVKKHAFVPRSVRRLYPGKHRIEISVGGQVLVGTDFHLLPW